MMSLDQSWLDAARTLGQSGWKTVGTLLLPVLRPALAAGSVLVSLYTLSDFGAVALLRYTTFTHAIYLFGSPAWMPVPPPCSCSCSWF